MSSFSARMRAHSDRLIGREKQGTILLLRPVTPEASPASEPWAAPPPNPPATEYELEGLVRVLPSGSQEMYASGTSVVIGLLELTCKPHAEVTPELTDHVSVDGEVYAVLRVTNVPPAGEPVAVKMVLGT